MTDFLKITTSEGQKVVINKNRVLSVEAPLYKSETEITIMMALNWPDGKPITYKVKDDFETVSRWFTEEPPNRPFQVK